MVAATTYEIACACEQVDAGHLAAQIAALTVLTPTIDPVVVPFAGGVAALSMPRLSRKLNHVSGAGMQEPITSEGLRNLHEVYRARGLTLELDLCPYAHRDSLRAVAHSELRVNAYSNTYWCALTSTAAAVRSTTIEVCSSSDPSSDAFIRTSVQGFLAHPQPRSHELLTLLARCACVRADTTLFTAKVNGKLAGTAALALFPTLVGSAAMLYLASTLPEFRGQGVQAELFAHRLAKASELGARMAVVTARPGTSSARNAERAGLQLAYTKPTFSARY